MNMRIEYLLKELEREIERDTAWLTREKQEQIKLKIARLKQDIEDAGRI